MPFKRTLGKTASGDLVGNALQTPGLRPTDKLVLVALAWHQEKMGEAFPSEKRLGELVGRDERTVRRSLKRLADRDLITITHRHGDRRLSNRYMLNLATRTFPTRTPVSTDISTDTDVISNRPTTSPTGHQRPGGKQRWKRTKHSHVTVREFGRRTTPVARSSPSPRSSPSVNGSPATSRSPSNQVRPPSRGVIGGNSDDFVTVLKDYYCTDEAMTARINRLLEVGDRSSRMKLHRDYESLVDDARVWLSQYSYDITPWDRVKRVATKRREKLECRERTA